MAYMAHQPDQALTAAIAQVLREARDRGMSTREIADYFGVADATISRWETGARSVALDLLPSFDRLAGQPRGYVLRRAGYVSDNADDTTTRTRYDVNFDDPDERDLWRLDHIPEPKRWQMILRLREINAEPPPVARKTAPRRRRRAG